MTNNDPKKQDNHDIQDNLEKKEHHYSRSWVDRLKDESWEAELLISTIAIFGIFQLIKIVNWIINFFIDKLHPELFYYGYLVAFFAILLVSILISMFIIHLFLRAFWVGIVGLSSVFPDYNIENSIYSPIYTKKMINLLPSMKESIDKSDQLCSVIFSAAFSIIMIYFYWGTLTTMYLLTVNALYDKVPNIIFFIPIILIGVLMIAQSIIGVFTMNKKNHHKIKLQNFGYHMSVVSNKMFLGPFFKSILQIFMIFGSNFKTNKRLIYLILVFVFTGMILSTFLIRDTNIYTLFSSGKINQDINKALPIYYESNLEKKNFLINPTINSKLIESKHLELFIPVFDYERKIWKNVCPDKDFVNVKGDKEKSRLIRQYYLDCYNQYHSVFVNEKEINLDLIKQVHPITGQFGVSALLDISYLDSGLHKIVIKKVFDSKFDSEWSIPFFYDAP